MAHYRKKYLCVCDGQQEELYLKHVAGLVKNFPQKVVTFDTIIGDVSRLEKTYQEYDSAALFDYDFKDIEFKRNIETCERLNQANKPTKRKAGRHIYHAYSNVNFDLWLILHKEDYFRSVSNNHAYIPDVRRIYGLGVTENIKNAGAIDKILGQITLGDVKDAISRADTIRSRKIDADRMIIGSTVCYPNPDFSIHEFLKMVLTDCGEL